MEFEGILLHSLLKSKNAAQWENELAGNISAIAGDDSTICLAAYGYKSYTALQKAFINRYSYLKQNYLLPISEMPAEDKESRFSLWETYRDNYMRYIKDGQV